MISLPKFTAGMLNFHAERAAMEEHKFNTKNEERTGALVTINVYTLTCVLVSTSCNKI